MGCAVVGVVLILGVALLVGIDWERVVGGGEDAGGDPELELALELAESFGDQPEVELVCRLPVVGEAPCLPSERAGSRELTATFTDYEPPAGVDPREHAWEIARAAYQSSVLVRESDRAVIVFHQGDESASVTRRYSFRAGELTAGELPP